MQFSLRSLLISFAVAGTGAGVFCVWYRRWFFEPDASAVGLVVIALLVSTLFGLVKAHKRRGVERVRNVVVPPLLAVLGIAYFTYLQTRHLMGKNASEAWRTCCKFAEAEEVYHKTDWDGDGVLEYAPTLKELRQKLAAAGSQDAIEQGLADAEWPSSTPFHGYYFKILKMTTHSYRHSFIDEDGNMTQGYALIAWPARYEWTGRDQFMISNNGTIFQSDYGGDLLRRGEVETIFDPTAPYWTVEE